jgi:mitochondrial fission process protein 1
VQASVAVPGYTINRVVKLTGWLCHRMPSLPPVAKMWVPTIVGLGVIPFIVHPIDSLVHYAMDKSIRPLAAKLLEKIREPEEKES